MKLSEFSVNNSMFVNLSSVFLVVIGIVSLVNLRREAFPPVNFNWVIVTTYFRNAPAEKVERLVTTPIERELKEVDNIDEILSKSDNGYSSIFLKIDSDIKDTRAVVNDIQKAIDRVRGLPEGVDEKPLVSQMLSGETPIIKISLGGLENEFVLRDQVDFMRERFEDISGVASVDRIGWRDEEYWIEVDLKKMKDYHISFQEIAAAVGSANVDTPGGTIKTNGEEFRVKIKGEIKNRKDIENTIIRANDLGNWVRVKDVAKVKHTFKEEEIINKTRGTRAISLTIIKKEKGDIIKIIDEVFSIIAELKVNASPELKISAVDDMSYYVKRRLKVLKSNGTIGFVLVILILFIFLPPAPAAMTALGIPIALFTTFWIMSCLDVTINLLTMFGLIMVIGIIVDDGVIISENIYRYMEEGLSPRDAAIKGAHEVTVPVIAMIATTIVAFIPLMVMGGIMGKFIKYIPLVIVLALIASLYEALIIMPSHMANFVKLPKRTGGRKPREWFNKLRSWYKGVLEGALRKRYLVIAATVMLLVSCIAIAKYTMTFELFGSATIELFMVNLEAEPDTPLEKTNELIAPIEKIISTIPDEYMTAFETKVGQMQKDQHTLERGANLAQVTVYLTPASSRKKSGDAIVEDIRPAIDKAFKELKLKGVKKLYIEKIKPGPPLGKAIDVRVRGNDYDTILAIVKEVKDYISSIDGIEDISDSYALGAKEINIVVDEEKAQKAFLTKAQIAYSIRAAFSGIVATTIKREKAEKEIKVLVTLPEEDRHNISIIDELVVPNKFNNLVPLKRVIKQEISRSMKSLDHDGGKRYVAVTAGVDSKKIGSVKANSLIQNKFADIHTKYPGYSLVISGEGKESMEAMKNLFKAFGIASLFIFLILATQFNSLVQPFIVMLNIPFSLIGFILAFKMHGEDLSFLGVMGLIGLIGVAVNDGIILVDFVNKRRNKMGIKDAVVEAGILRLRPVLLTSLTTVCGLSTVAYGIGGLDPFLKPMALAMSWGLVFSTILTLIVIPCVYLVAEDIKAAIRRTPGITK